jgi:5-methylcytosine-specific restriction endonuclease McrA
MRRTVSRIALALFLLASLLLPGPADARGKGGSSVGPHRPHSSIRCESCPRDRHGHIQRSREAVEKFKHANPKPAGCDRCEVDHIVPLSKGGADTPSSMQWLPRDQHIDKTKRDLHP